jgi:hypothetical protein
MVVSSSPVFVPNRILIAPHELRIGDHRAPTTRR